MIDADTIAAVATPAGSGAVGVIRVSGPRAVAIAAGLVGRAPEGLPDRRVVYGVARDPRSGERLDEVLVVAMRAPRSYTGEDVAEVHGHGGAANMARLFRAVLAAGARAAEPGEFTRRAFENGRMDLTRAEAVADVIAATSERALRAAQAQLEGAVGRVVVALRREALDRLAEVEADIDFPDEGLELSGAAELGARAAELGRRVQALADSYGTGRALFEGVTVAIVGPVNAGKSSLLNALVGRERAIVTAEPGTTRDCVEEQVVWDGVRVTLVDTAGERPAQSEAERRGIELGRRRAAQADVVVVAVPGPDGAGAPDPVPRELRVVTKADLGIPAGFEGVVTSVVDGRGIEELRHAILARTVGVASEGGDGVVVTSERQRALLQRAAARADAASTVAAAGAAPELVAVELRDAVSAFDELLGDRVDADVLDVLFARFCIGK